MGGRGAVHKDRATISGSGSPGLKWMIEMEHAIGAQPQYTQRGKRESLLCSFESWGAGPRGPPPGASTSLAELADRPQNLRHGLVDGVVDALVVDHQNAGLARFGEDVLLNATDLAEVGDVLS